MKTIFTLILFLGFTSSFAEMKEACSEFKDIQDAATHSHCFTFDAKTGVLQADSKAESFVSQTAYKDNKYELTCYVDKSKKYQSKVKIAYQLNDQGKVTEIKIKPQTLDKDIYYTAGPAGAAFGLYQLFRKKPHAFFTYDDKGQCFHLAKAPGKDTSGTTAKNNSSGDVSGESAAAPAGR